jgi:endo-1,4-beta-xylanase
MKKYILVVPMAVLLLSFTQTKKNQGTGLGDAFAGKFYIGTALNADQITGKDTGALRIIKQHFTAIVPENCMKIESIQPREGVFDFTLADKFVQLGEEHHMFVTGHTLVWHSQVPPWFFTDAQGKDVSRQELIQRMKTHIFTVVGRYRGRIKGWDVVNEALMEDGSLRKSKFLQIIGQDYIALAFAFAHQADPQAELYYNDYGLADPRKREGVIKLVRGLQQQGLRVDAIGEQAHVGLDYPDLGDFEQSLVSFAALGLKVQITEMDITLLPMPQMNHGADVATRFSYSSTINPYAQGLPDSVNLKFEQRYMDFFRLFLKHRDIIKRVTLWGVNDAQSWRNDWPVPARTDYPLLFDRSNHPKPVVERIMQEAQK